MSYRRKSTIINKKLYLDIKDQNLLIKAQGRVKQNIILQYCEKTMNQATTIIKAMKRHLVFYNLNSQQLNNVQKLMFKCLLNQKDIIYTQGDPASCFFIIRNGQVTLTYQEEQISKQLKPNQSFGQNGLLVGREHEETAVAKEDCQLWVIDRKTFQIAVQQVMTKQFEEHRLYLERINFFSGFTQKQKTKISMELIQKIYYKGQTIVKQGDPGSFFLFIKDGSTSAYQGGKLIRKLLKGEGFGEQSLLYNTMRQFTLIADEDTIMLLLGRNKLFDIIGSQNTSGVFENFMRLAFFKDTLIQNLDRQDIEKLTQIMKIKRYKANQIIFREGINGFQKLVVVVQGQLIYKKTGVAVATKGQCCGGNFMSEDNQKKYLPDDIMMGSVGILAECCDIDLLYKFKIRLFDTEDLLHKSRLPILCSQQKSRQQNLSQIQLRDLLFVKQVTQTQYGFIYLTKIRKSQQLICVKSYQKEKLKKQNIEYYVVNQAEILMQTNHPLILNCGNVFHNNTHALIVSEYIEGEDLIDVMNQKGVFPVETATFFIANIILILEHLSSEQIILRDVRPESFMVEKTGFIKLMNFPLAKKVRKDKTHGKTYTVVGMPHYVAPQIITGKSYNNMVDLWALGILAYQLLCGEYPFGEYAETTFEIYEDILHAQLHFPEFISNSTINIIQQLLSQNPSQRLGGSFEQLKRNSWFKKIKWWEIAQKKQSIDIPYKIDKKMEPKMQSQQIPLLQQLQRRIPTWNQNNSELKETELLWKQFSEIIE